MTNEIQDTGSPDHSPAAAILGYLNFSNGRPDPSVQKAFSELFAERPLQSWNGLAGRLEHELNDLVASRPAFAEAAQARAIIKLVFNKLKPAYTRHHADLLFHVSEEQLLQPYFVARLCEAVLSAGGPWNEDDRIVATALAQLNDFVGYRPLAILEDSQNDPQDGQEAQIYLHERFRPIPLYLKNAGVAVGPYHDLIAATMRQLRDTPAALREDAGFYLERLEELAVDIRAHDSLHPVFKRTNYLFGEWDPHAIDNDGYFHRLVVRRVILDSLTRWVESPDPGIPLPRAERLYDASAVLTGTILMASAISGWGPAAHDSGTSLSQLLPIVAHQRDEYYAELMRRVSGSRAARLSRVIDETRQPMGHVRQQLNIYLANYAAAQMQRSAIAEQYARMGYGKAARSEAARIPAASVRMECELDIAIEAADRDAESGVLSEGLARLREATDLLTRGIECGAFIDPWNILGFQGQFPLFAAREDAIPDPRAEWLIESIDRLFTVARRLLTEAAGRGDAAVRQATAMWLDQTADWWDRYATSVVQDLPPVNGHELAESAKAVAETIAEWRSAGHAAGDLAFWRDRVHRLETPHAFADVVETLLDRQDPVSASGLLVQWLGQAEEIGLGEGRHSFYHLAIRWLREVTEGSHSHLGLAEAASPAANRGTLVRRFLDFIEANAGEFWSVPTLMRASTEGDDGSGDWTSDDDDTTGDAFAGDWSDEEDDDEDDDLFGAAYDNVTFRDSSGDGVEGDVLDAGPAASGGEFDANLRHLAARLQFHEMLGLLWRYAAGRIEGDDDYRSAARGWHTQAGLIRDDLVRLARVIGREPLRVDGGDFDANLEYDAQLQSKNHLLHLVISAAVKMDSAERLLAARISPTASDSLADKAASRQRATGKQGQDDPVTEVLRGILQGRPGPVADRLPALLRKLSRQPLLYQATESGGDPLKVVAARSRYDLLAILVVELPRLGLLRQTRQVLGTALRAERKSRPGGMSITEFDRLFRLALETVLLAAVGTRGHEPAAAGRQRRSATSPLSSLGTYHHPAASRLPMIRRRTGSPARQRRVKGMNGRRNWPRSRPGRGPRLQDMETVRLVGLLVENYLGAWLQHAGTMRLSTVEEFNNPELWSEVQTFIHRFGAELFHARVLPLANLRPILHEGIDQFLEYLAENDDPLRPSGLIAAIENEPEFQNTAERMLTLIFSTVVDEMERFVEYNSTTTQSDYGQRFDSFLDFLRAEAAYRRDEWDLTPLRIAHQVLAVAGRAGAARLWTSIVAARTSEAADAHVARLAALEKQHAMTLPTISDHIGERFVKPFAIDRIIALVPAAVREAGGRRSERRAFGALRREVESYLSTTTGSAADLPEWLDDFEAAVRRAREGSRGAGDDQDSITGRPFLRLRRDHVLRQIETEKRRERRGGEGERGGGGA